ncbi:hypothetical protein BGX29_007645 [Mortierella sp. GBA35]|nr:hypothetical protein BGX29_007645 [Mortierella sp. GBA35]
MATTTDIHTLKARIARYTNHIRFHEANEGRLIDLLYPLPSNAENNNIFIFNGVSLSMYQLRCQLHEARLLVYLYSIALRDAINILLVLGPKQGENSSYALGNRVRLLMERLKAEDATYNTSTECALANHHYVFKNRWLMYKYGQQFQEHNGCVPHPGGTDPDIEFTQGQLIQ